MRPLTHDERERMRNDLARADEVFAKLSDRQKEALVIEAVYSNVGWRATTCISSLRLIGALRPGSSSLTPLGMVLRQRALAERASS